MLHWVEHGIIVLSGYQGRIQGALQLLRWNILVRD